MWSCETNVIFHWIKCHNNNLYNNISLINIKIITTNENILKNGGNWSVRP